MVEGGAGIKYASASETMPTMQRIAANPLSRCQRLNPSMGFPFSKPRLRRQQRASGAACSLDHLVGAGEKRDAARLVGLLSVDSGRCEGRRSQRGKEDASSHLCLRVGYEYLWSVELTSPSHE